jgi:hypothetical protein
MIALSVFLPAMLTGVGILAAPPAVLPMMAVANTAVPALLIAVLLGSPFAMFGRV